MEQEIEIKVAQLMRDVQSLGRQVNVQASKLRAYHALLIPLLTAASRDQLMLAKEGLDLARQMELESAPPKLQVDQVWGDLDGALDDAIATKPPQTNRR